MLLPNTQNREARVGSFAEATAFANVVVLAVKGSVAADALRLATAPNQAGKLVIDATNPIADLPPENGVLRFFTLAESLMERDFSASFQRRIWSRHSIQSATGGW